MGQACPGSTCLASAGAQLDESTFPGWSEAFLGEQRTGEYVALWLAWRMLLTALLSLLWRTLAVCGVRVSAAAARQALAVQHDAQRHQAHQDSKCHDGDEDGGHHALNLAKRGLVGRRRIIGYAFRN